MAEHEVAIKIKVDDEASSKLANMKKGLADMGGVEVTGKLEAMTKHVYGMNIAMKNLATQLGRGGPGFESIAAFARGFAVGGPIILGIEAVLKITEAAFNMASSRSKQLADLATMARRAGLHPAQFQANAEVFERVNVPLERSSQQMEHLNDVLVRLKTGDQNLIDDLFKGITDPADEAYVRNKIDQITHADNTTALNILRQWYDEVFRRYSQDQSAKVREQAPGQAGRLYEIFLGSRDLENVKENFRLVSDQEKEDMDAAVKAAQDFNSVSESISQHWDHIKEALIGPIMSGPIGRVLRLIEKGLGTEEHRLETTERPWWWRIFEYMPLPALFRTTMSPSAWEDLSNAVTGPGTPQQLLGGDRQSLLNTTELLAQFTRLNALLSGEEPRQKAPGEELHNAPQGGTRGESNPIKTHPSHPGGGAAYEAREPSASTIYYTGSVGSMVGGKPGVQYKDPATGEIYVDRTAPIGPPASGLPSEVPGIAYGHRVFKQHGKETLGGYYLVTPKEGTNAGQTFILPHSDIGPGGPKGHPEIGAKTLDYNAPAAQMVFGSMKERDVHGGAYIQYIGKDLPENIDVGRQKPEDVLGRQYRLSESHLAAINKTILAQTGPGFRGGRDVAAEYASVETSAMTKVSDAGYRGSGGRGGDQYDRSQLDNGLASENRISASGRLEVAVNAPAGTEVKAEGDGMFAGAGNVSIDRRIPLM